jgi:hypothetical protein
MQNRGVNILEEACFLCCRFYDALTMCPRTMCPKKTKILGRSVPRIMLPEDIASLGHGVPD